MIELIIDVLELSVIILELEKMVMSYLVLDLSDSIWMIVVWYIMRSTYITTGKLNLSFGIKLISISVIYPSFQIFFVGLSTHSWWKFFFFFCLRGFISMELTADIRLFLGSHVVAQILDPAIHGVVFLDVVVKISDAREDQLRLLDRRGPAVLLFLDVFHLLCKGLS